MAAAALRRIPKLVTNLSIKHDVWFRTRRLELSYFSKEYDEKYEPSLFFDNHIQQLLLELTRTDMKKIFRKRGVGELEDPKYEFLTDEQLKDKLDEVKKKAKGFLQFPPAVVVRKSRDTVFSMDPALKGLETSKIVFTDITFGLKDNERLIVVRDLDGTLKEADWTIRDRVNQVYFPREYRRIKIPHLFKDSYFEDILNRKEYVFLLDLACQQFEPDDPEYQKIVSITYQHINDNNEFEKLRSTRHFGSMTFFLVWHKIIDNLLLDLIETCYLGEAKVLIELYGKVHKIQFTKSDQVEMIEEFIRSNSNKKAVLELALQATKDFLKQQKIIEEGIKKSHGHG